MILTKISTRFLISIPKRIRNTKLTRNIWINKVTIQNNFVMDNRRQEQTHNFKMCVFLEIQIEVKMITVKV